MSQSSNALLDHFILHVPYAYLSDPPSWIKDHFTITPGGEHADGLTANTLVLFRDGTYIELIAWTPKANDENKKGHM